jgi:chromate transport protein ChrA
MPAAFLGVYVGVLVLCGWVGWKTQREGWFVAAFAWLLFVGPACWLMAGAVGS